MADFTLPFSMPTGYMTPEEEQAGRRAMINSGLLNAAIAVLGQPRFSTQPQSMGQTIAQGMGGFLGGAGAANEQYMQNLKSMKDIQRQNELLGMQKERLGIEKAEEGRKVKLFETQEGERAQRAEGMKRISDILGRPEGMIQTPAGLATPEQAQDALKTLIGDSQYEKDMLAAGKSDLLSQFKPYDKKQELMSALAGIPSHNDLLLKALGESILKPKDTVMVDGLPVSPEAALRAKTQREEGAENRKAREAQQEASRDLKRGMQSMFESERYERMRESKRGQLVQSFNADPNVRKIESMNQSAELIKDVVRSGNPIGNSSLPTIMARVSGEVGNLSEADKAPFGGSKAISEKITQKFNELYQGKNTEANLKWINQLADTMDKAGQKKKEALARNRAAQYSRAYKYLSQDEIYNTLMPEGATGDVRQGMPSSGGMIGGSITIKGIKRVK